MSKITKNIFRSGMLSVRHVVLTRRAPSIDPKSHDIHDPKLYNVTVSDVNDYRSGRTLRKDSVNLWIDEPESSIIFENSSKIVDTDGKLKRSGIFVYVDGDFMYQLNRAFMNAQKWMVDTEFSKLFVRDIHDVLIEISRPLHETVRLKYNQHLLLTPAILTDDVGVTHEAVQLKCDKGVLGTISGESFVNLACLIHEISTNFYGLSLQLSTYGLGLVRMDKEIQK